MLKKELMNHLTLNDIGIHSNLTHCVVCDLLLFNNIKLVLVDIDNLSCGWLCPKCTTYYDYEDNLIDIGDCDEYSEIRGYA
tara:strand:+ start:868 stop:1110 length:243 start_codon:yes stop_codon:yes gene_type:complete